MSRHRFTAALIIALPILLQVTCDTGCIQMLLADTHSCHGGSQQSPETPDECRVLMTYRQAAAGWDIVIADLGHGSVVSAPAVAERTSFRISQILPVVPELRRLNLRI